MIEKQIDDIWRHLHTSPSKFEGNAHIHFRMVKNHQYSQLFERFRPEVTKTYSIIKNNLVEALFSEVAYIRSLATLIQSSEKAKLPKTPQQVQLANLLSMV